MPDNINKKYDAKHLARIIADQKRIKKAYLNVIEKIYKKTAGITLKGDAFQISSYPGLHNEIDKALLSFTKEVDFVLQNGIKDQWELSTEKNAAMIHKQYGEKNIIPAVNNLIYDPQSEALAAFTKRTINGLGLSDRVLKYTSQLQGQIEQNIFAGLSEGKSAAAMARDQVAYMENPEPLFRRVRDAKGKLQLSKAAKKYYDDLGSPGRGVYRSPYKNFMRMTRDTVNDSYRESDMVRYQALPFIIGYDVKLSNRHPMTDICDDLKGTYPKTFVWRKWHIQCICNCTSKLATPEEFDRYQEAVLNGTDANFKFKGQVNDLPDRFNKYVTDKTGSMDNWKRKPDWVTENGIKI